MFAAQDLKHDRRVAIKILKAEIAQTIAADRFLREIRIDAALQHPRILPLFDSGEVLGSPYFVMPYMGGATLRARLQRESPLPIDDAVRIATQVADALQYLHEHDLVHRDVKPENILLQGDHVWLADFGIARALQDAVTPNVTVTGTAVGTPAYMSPEQRLGAPTIDGRSDQFSLACVLYEMLAGRPPKVFDRSDVVMTPDGPRITPTGALRKGVPKGIDDVLARALQMNEDDRWPSMKEFAERLLNPNAPAARAVLPTLSRPWLFARNAAATAAAVVLVAVIWYALMSGVPTLDALSVAVLPMAHEGDADGAVLDGDDCSRFLRDAIGRWTGIHHVDDMQLRDVRKRLGRPETLDAAMKMARELHAGLAVWGFVGPTVATDRNSARSIRVFLYDVASGRVREEATGVIDGARDIELTFQSLVDSLLSGTAGSKRPVPVSGTRDFLAVRAYLDGHRALNSFDVATAALDFRRAAEIDPNFGLAFLWLAWSTLWTPESSPRDWGAAASRALAVGTGLTPRDIDHARALVSMNERHFAEACDLFRSLTKADARDFSAWYGLGECLSADYAVVPSVTSPSGWQFRTSMREAIGAYQNAVDLAPSFTDAMGQRAMQRISRWLFSQTGRFRAGMNADSMRFAAWPSLAGDTLAFVPFNLRAVMAESAGTREATYHQAIEQNKARVLALVNRWVSLDPSNSLALESLALAREANDEIMALRRSEVGLSLTGMAAIRRARVGATGENAVRLTATELRFLLKTDRLTDAKKLADSLLVAVPMDSASAGTASWMQSVAMLTGNVRRALQWGHRSAAFQYRDPVRPDESVSPALSAAASDAATFAVVGAPADSIRAAIARTERALREQGGPTVENMRQLYVELPLLYAWPSLGPAVAPPSRPGAGNRWLTIQLALARRDTATARRDMWLADSSSARGGSSEVAFEIAMVNSRLWLALGDTASAMRVVTTATDLVRTSGEQLMTRPTATAAFVRTLVQRATLAALRGDTAQARAWGTRAMVLWHDADPMLANVMRPVLRWRDIPIPGGAK